jgi:DNA-binding response OmpR family regulator
MKILVADDSPVIRTAVSVVLSADGHEIVTAEDGIGTIQAVYREMPDLIVLDIQMPRMTGYMACRLLKEDWTVAHIPVLILTAHDSTEDRYWAAKSGADGYLTKEALGDDLAAAVKSVSASRALSELSGSQQADPIDLDQMDVLERVTSMLDRKLFEMTVVNDIVTLSTRPLDVKTTLVELMFIVRRFVSFDVAALALVDEKAISVHVDRALNIDEFESFVDRAARELHTRADLNYEPSAMQVWRSDSIEMLEADSEKLASTFAVELKMRGDVIGLLLLGATAPNAFAPGVAKTLRAISSPMATVIDSSIHHAKLIEEEARHSLSSLYEN